MKRIVKTTGDNSRTLYIEELDECYHSHHGALQEAEHVFIKNGLEKLDKKEINILEMGFGTGLNVLVKIELPEIDLVYYDCFGARVQPDLWEKPLFELVKTKMKKGGLLTTYSSKGSVRRALQELGFEVQKLEGPKGKREMLNAVLL